MTPDYAKKEDLYKMKSDINTEQREARHQQNDIIQKLANDVDSNKSDNRLLKQSQNFMTKEISEIKKMLSDFIDKADEKFATKEDHMKNQKSIEWIIKILWTVWISIIGWGGAFIWSQFTNLIDK